MIKCDYHTHTGFSDDCAYGMDEMIEAAIAQGIETLAITDHYDPDYPTLDMPFELDFDKYIPALKRAAKRYENQIQIAKGVEIGIKEGSFDKARAATRLTDFDVIIGSFHCYKDIDISMHDFSKVEPAGFLKNFYEYMYECLREYDDFDILGHFSIMDRYIGGLYDYRPYEEIIHEILKLIIRRNKAIEINTSSFAYGLDTWLPRESILKKYKELGGELLTIGSDAHVPSRYRSHFDEAAEFAKALGFGEYHMFLKRKPMAISF